MVIRNNTILLSFLTSVWLTGCGDGSDGGAQPLLTKYYTVKAIDGYLVNAHIWLDLNGDFLLTDGEPSAVTSYGGLADLDVTGIDNYENHPIIVKAIKNSTVDEETGNTISVNYTMVAPAGERFITPLSTLVQLRLVNNNFLAKEDAISEVAGELGIIDEQVLGDYIDSGNTEAALGARVLVFAGVLAETPEQLVQQVNEGSTGTIISKATETNIITKNYIENLKLQEGYNEHLLKAANVILNSNGTIAFDTDGDGIIDLDDAFPLNATESLDTDGDVIGNNADPDDDDDGIIDLDDAFPLDATESLDTDGDGVGNNTDPDDDGDGIIDLDDAFPLDATEPLDTDGDGVGNNADTDDGIIPEPPHIKISIENQPLYSTESLIITPVITPSSVASISWNILNGAENITLSSQNTALTEIFIGDVEHETGAKLSLTVTDNYSQSTTEYVSLNLLPIPEDDSSYFTWPINCLVGEDCGVGYADIDDTNLSYDCGIPGYQNHQGTDIYLIDNSHGWDLMDAGVDILAAQSGTVLFVLNDPNAYDRCGSTSDDVTEEELLYCKEPKSTLLFAGEKENNTACTSLGDYCPNGEGLCYWCFASPNLVAIKHDHSGMNSLITIYEHIKTGSILVQEGDFIQRGQKIAEVGSAGNSTGPHLHFEVWGGFGHSTDPFYGACGPNYDVKYWVLNEKPWLVKNSK